MLTELLLGAIALAAGAESNPLTASSCEFGDSYQVSNVHCAIAFANSSNETVFVTTQAMRPFDSIQPSSAAITAGSTAYFDTTLNLEHDLGRVDHVFFSMTKAGAKRYVGVSGFVMSVLDDPNPEIDFGTVLASSRSQPRKSLSLESREVSGLSIRSVLKKPAYVDAEIGGDGKTLSISMKPGAPWGLIDAYVTLGTNSSKQSSINVHLKGDVHGEIVPAENPFGLGLIRKGEGNEVLVRLTNSSGRDFKVGQVKFDRLAADVTFLPCKPVVPGCKLLRLSVLDEQPTGVINGGLTLDLPEFGHKLPIRFQGMIINHDTKIKDFNKKETGSDKEADADRTEKSTSRTKVIDLDSALRHTTSNTDIAPAGKGPLLKWNVTHEELIYGYVVYRSTSQTGPYLRVNGEIIRAKRDDPESAYQWRDNSARSENAYWYYVGLLRNSGIRENLSDPQKVVAK